MPTTCAYPGLNVRRASMVHRRGVLPSVCNVRAEIDPNYPCGGTLTWTHENTTWTFTGCRVRQTYKDHQYDRTFVGWNHQILDRRASWPETLVTMRVNVFRFGRLQNENDAKAILQYVFSLIGEDVNLDLMPTGFYPEVEVDDVPATQVLKYLLEQTFTTIVPTLQDSFAVVPLGHGGTPPLDDALHRVEPFCGTGPSEIRVDMRPTVFQYPVFVEPVVMVPSAEGRNIVRLRDHAASQWLGLNTGYRNLNPFIPWVGVERVPLSSMNTEFEMSGGGPAYNHAFTMFRLAVNHDHLNASPAAIGVTAHNGKGVSAPGYNVTVDNIGQVTMLEKLVDGDDPWLFGRYHGSTQFVGMDSLPSGPADTLLAPFRGTAYRNLNHIPDLWSVRTADPLFIPLDRKPVDYGNPQNVIQGSGWATEPILWLYCAYTLRENDGTPVRKSYNRTLGGSGPVLVYRGNRAHVRIYRNNTLTLDNEQEVEQEATNILDAIEQAVGQYPRYDISYGGIKPFLPTGRITRTDWHCDAVKAPTSRVLIGVEDDLWD